MTQTPYQRVDTQALEQAQEQHDDAMQQADTANYGIRWTVLPLVMLLSLVQVFVTLYGTHYVNTTITSTLIGIIAFAALFIGCLFVNPMLQMPLLKAAGVLSGFAIVGVLLFAAAYKSIAAALSFELAYLWVGVTCFVAFILIMRLFRYRRFNRQEMICVFAALTVSSGVSTFGLTDQLVPIVMTPKNPQWNTEQKGWEKKVNTQLNPALYIQDPKIIDDFSKGYTYQEDGKTPIKAPESAAPMDVKLAYYKDVFFAIPWMSWAKPIFFWLIFIGAVYALYYSLTYVLLGSWTDREKLIFPLARLPEALLPDTGPGAGWLPRIAKTPGFWIGFGIAFLVLGWNGLNTSNSITNLGTIPLGMNKFTVTSLVSNTIFEGTGNGIEITTMFLVIFTAIGIAFLLPLEISFSIWAYFVASRFFMLVLVWMGYGQTQRDFPSDWLWDMNAVTAQGGGGMLMFSAICLYRAIKDYLLMIKGKALAERFVILIPLIGLVLSVVVLTAWLYWNQIPIIWALVFVALITLLTIGLMRIVAEGGIYWFQSHTSFFHLYRITGGFGGYLPGNIVAPLFPIYSVLFMDIKAHMAPNIMNVANIQAKNGGSRFKFHTAIISSLILSVVVALAFVIFLGYIKQGNQLHSWFYSSAPQGIMARAQGVMETPTESMPGMVVWYVIGAAWVGASFIIRTTVFGFPHPVGYIMLINPLMSSLWFSFFIGWVFKKLVVKYGGKMTFDRVRDIFIGLILGELLAIFFWLLLGLFTKIQASNITLNRYS